MTAAQLSTFQRWSILAGAAILLSLAMGMRQSFGLFQPSILHDTAITTADFSLATALQNVVWGVSQPIVGMLADRFGARYVMLTGVLVYAAGLLIMMISTSALVFTIGAGLCIGLALSGTASSMTITVTSRTVSAAKRSVAMGAVSAAGSLGLVIASPLAQTLISSAGWQMALIGFLGLGAGADADLQGGLGKGADGLAGAGRGDAAGRIFRGPRRRNRNRKIRRYRA